MSRFNQLLAALLTLQLVVAGGLYFYNRPQPAGAANQPLVAATPQQIDRITITDEQGGELILQRDGNDWQLPGYFQLPAQGAKVSAMLDKLTTTTPGYPVATTAASQRRFKVADQEFGKKIVLNRGGQTLATLYLGTSPGFRQIHLRRAGEEAVYAVKLNSFDFPTKADAWLDTSLLQPRGEIAAIQGPDYALTNHGGQWQLKEGEGEVDAEAVKRLTDALANMRVLEAGEPKEGSPGQSLTLQAGGETLTYRFFKDGGHYYVSRDDRPQWFRISQTDYDKISGEKAPQLVKRSDSTTPDVATNPDKTEKPTADQHG